MAKRKPGKAAQQKVGIAAQVSKIRRPSDLHREAVALHVMEAIRASRVPTFSLQRSKGHDVFQLDRGNGDRLTVAFTDGRHLVFGFDHESPMSPFQVGHVWPGVYDGLPGPLRPFVAAAPGDDAFAAAKGAPEELAAATFAAWWHEGRWSHGAIDFPKFDAYSSDGAAFLIGCITPEIVFVEQGGWDEAAVARIQRHEPISDGAIRALHADADLAAVRAAMSAVGYGAPFPFAE